mmetsp:Transcript_21788/g.19849  ORF Transcript_21788/g.19849 Transcript_21788/m.19849 type:complete len:99 (+) Transcript_21788:91-387(+)
MSIPNNENAYEKAIRKLKNEPLIPLGALATVGFLVNGLRNLYTGNQKQSQLMMRYRVAAQLFTIVVVAVSAQYGLKVHDRPKNMEEKMAREDNDNSNS